MEPIQGEGGDHHFRPEFLQAMQALCHEHDALFVLDEVPDNVFATSSRINSTWGGSLTDMVRSRRILEVVESERLIDRAADLGPVLLGLLTDLAGKHEQVTDVRGRGLMCAFSLPTAALRDELLSSLREDEHVLLLGCGSRSVRFRPALTVSPEDLAAGVAALDRVLTRLTEKSV